MAKIVASVAVVCVSFILISYYLPCIAMMTGGISPVDQPSISTEIMEGLAIFLTSESRALQNVSIYKGICNTLHASVQVVQGTLYRVALKIVPVDKQLDQEGCIEGDDSVVGDEKFVCFAVWVRPWLEDKEKRLIVEEKAADDYKSCLQVNS